MKKNCFFAAAFFCLLLTACSFNMPIINKPTGSHTSSSPLQTICDELNYVRTRPNDYAEKVLRPRLARFNGYTYKQDDGSYVQTHEGAAAVQEAINTLKSAQAMSALTLDTGLSQASSLLAAYQAQTGQIGHVGPNNLTMRQRIEQYGSWSGYIGENCAYGSTAARDIVAQLIIDDGFGNRGHRINILNESFSKVGIALQIGDNAPYGSVCVMDFATSFQPR